MLQSWKVIPKEADLSCVLCGSETENADHLFGVCLLVWGLWNSLLNLFGCGWVFNKSIGKIISSWGRGSMWGNWRDAWLSVLASVEIEKFMDI